MKILYHHRIRSKDGQYVHVEELTNALRLQGHELIIVGPGHVNSAEFGADAGFVATLKRHLPKAIYELLELAYSALACARVLAAGLRHRPDFIYERYNLLNPAGSIAKRLLRLPLLLEINAPLFQERARFDGIALKRLARWSERYVWRSADAALPVTGVLARMVEESGVPADRITVIHNGIALEHFDGNDRREEVRRRLGLSGRRVLGFVGFVRSWHGLDRIIEFLAQERNADLHLLIVGDGPARAELEEAARTSGVAERVTFTGVVEREEIPSFVGAFDIALQPAVVEYASPLKLFEYMAMGKAIVAPASPNILEILEDGQNGLLFEAGNINALVEAVRRLVANRDLCQRLGAGARRTIEERGFTWQRNAERVVGIAKELKSAG